MKFKKLLTALVLSFTLVLAPVALTGCAAKTAQTPTPPLAPGYINQADQQMKAILDGATAFYNSIQKKSDSGEVILSKAEKDAFNSLGVSINIAQPIYLAFHNGAGSQQAAQNAVNQVQSNQSAVQALGVK